MSIGTVYNLVDTLESMVLRSTPIPLTRYVVISEQKLTDGFDKIRAAVPNDVDEALNIIKRRDEILQSAEARANQIITEARQRADMLLAESELLNAVQSEADKIRQQVIADCELMKKQAKEEVNILRNNAISESIAIREGADKYAESLLASLDKDLSEMHEVVRNGQRHLARTKTESIAAMAAQTPRANAEQVSKLVNAMNQEEINY